MGSSDLECTRDTKLGGWGGLGGHVRLVRVQRMRFPLPFSVVVPCNHCRSAALYAIKLPLGLQESRAAAGWIVHPHVQHELAAPGFDAATVNVSIEIGHRPGGRRCEGSLSSRFSSTRSPSPYFCFLSSRESSTALTMDVAIVDPANKTVGHSHTACVGSSTCTSSLVSLINPPLWSPDTAENQHTARITLATASGEVLDSASVRFGVRKLEIIGYHWKLNGAWLYLHGAQPETFKS